MSAIALDLHDITNDMSDWNQHWSAFSNVVQIYEAYKSNSLTNRVREQIGEESFSNIVNNFVHYVKEFFHWLYDKIRSFFSAIIQFIRRIITKIKRFLFGSDTPKSRSEIIRLCTMQRKVFAELNMTPKYMYDVNDFVATYILASENMFPKYTEERYTLNTIKHAVSDIRTVYKEVTDELHAACMKKITDKSEINKQNIVSLSTPEMLNNQFAIVEQTYSKLENDLNKFKSTSITDDNVFEVISTFGKSICDDCKNVLIVIDDHNNTASITSSRTMIDCANSVLTSVGIISSEGAKWLELYENLLLKVYNIYNIKGTAINIQERIPSDMVKHLQSMYGGSLETGKVYISNTSLGFWDTVGNELGATISRIEGSNVTYKNITVRVNANTFLLGDKTRESDRHHYVKQYSLNSEIADREQLLLSIIVHEFSHAFDDQHGRDMTRRGSNTEPVPEDMDSAYWNIETEQRARSMQRIYVPTNSELSWAKSVIRRLDIEFSKMPKLNTIDLPDSMYT